jgi:hypothetical protein
VKIAMTLAEQRKKLRKQLKALKAFSNTAAVRRLRQELNRKLDALEAKAERGRQTKMPTSNAAAQKAANAARAGKLRKYHNYLRQIRDSYPNLTYRELRRQFSERKRGKQTKVPDVIWRNPSP